MCYQRRPDTNFVSAKVIELFLGDCLLKLKEMEYLVKLVTPTDGIVLDPFMGSGTTGIACKRNGFGFIGIELEEKYFKIAQKRIIKED